MILGESRASRQNETTLAVAVVAGQEKIREMFSLGVNFVLYKPVSYERALSTLRAAQSVLFRDKRKKPRASVHTHATIAYADVEQAKATLVDLAEDGMAVNFGQKLPPTCKVYFQFQLPGETANVRLSGHVVWQDWNGRAGIQFMDVPQSSRRILHAWLQANVADASARALASEQVEVEHSILPTDRQINRPNESSATIESGPVARQEFEKFGEGQSDARHTIDPLFAKQLEKQQIENTKETGAEKDATARLRAQPANRRGQTRYACRVGAEVYQQGSSVRNYCHLSDVSPGGCYLEMPLAFPGGTTVEIIVRTHEIKLRLIGKVKASHPGYGMGVAFQLNTKDERHGVQQLIDFVAATAESSS
jgi:hypothetical protein